MEKQYVLTALYKSLLYYFRQIDMKWAIGLQRWKLQFIGLWRVRSDYTTSTLLSNIRYGMILCLVCSFCLIPGVLALQKVWGNLTLMIDNLNFTLSICAAVIKFLILRPKIEDLAFMNDTMIADWLKVKTEQEINVMRKWALIPRVISIVSICIDIATLTMIFVFPWLGFSTRIESHIPHMDNRFVMQTYFFYDTSKISYFIVTYFMQNISLCICGIIVSAIDSYLPLIVLHVCGQLQNLSEQIRRLNDTNDFRRGMMHCVTEHIRLLRCIEIVDNCFSSLLLMVVIYLTILFCFQGFIIFTELNGGNFSIGRSAIVTAAIVFTVGHFGMFCIVGEILVTQCERIHYTVYDYEWFELHPRNTRCFIFLMLRSGKPSYITAGKFFPMTMSTFCSLLKTSAGYISVLLANQN